MPAFFPSLTKLLRQLLLLALVLWLPTSAASPALSEQAVKSALLLKLTKFVYLPQERTEETPVLCVLGNNPFAGSLEALIGAATDERSLQLAYPESSNDVDECHFVFVARSESRQVAAVIKQLQQHPLVTISDIDGFARRGGMVELALDKSGSGQIKILINRKAAAAQGIEFNAQLLRLATLVN